jgi:ABC-type Zn uptake system ZnuABC Zn-binding protein ZnuA
MFNSVGIDSAKRALALSWILWLLLLTVTACAPDGENRGTADDQSKASEANDLALPALEAIPPDARAHKVVATTGIIGDVVSNIAGDSAEVNVLMAANQDPHSFQSTAGDLRLVADADVVFVNGWRLEEGLLDDLENAAGNVPFVPISAGIEGRMFTNGEGDNDEAFRIDPHVWLAPANVVQWVDNIETALTTLDPDNADAYQARADSYREEVRELDGYYNERLETIEPKQRVMVTNHDAFGYFADEFGFEVVGTVIPGDSTLAEPSSRDLASLVQSMQDASICSIFVERSANQQLATQLANDLDSCEEVQIVSLYSGALGEAGSGAESYLEMMRVNIEAIVEALGPAISAPSE